ncbi:diguanylate cyclase [Ningiella sp. W23]|uniref:GGDEF domain-containing protein n=1 Tax=Ningiella sp. W23 TaxID=3023715 RepID=UPI003757EB8B
MSEADVLLHDKKQNRRSLRLVFTLSLGALLMVFSAVSVFTFYRLLETNSVIKELADKSIPRILKFDQIANTANELRQYTEQLSNARTPPSLRLARSNTQAKVEQISTLFNEVSSDPITITEFDAISEELLELQALVEKRLLIVDSLNIAEGKVYRLLSSFASLHPTESDELLNRRWAEQYADLFTLTTQALALNRLNEIRQLKDNIQASVNKLLPPNDFPGLELQQTIRQLYDEFADLVLSQRGVIDLRMEQLKIEGRAVGRGNFTANLVADFARSVQFQAALISQAVVEESSRKNRMIGEQIQVITISLSVALVILIIITWHLKVRVIDRLTTLDNLVKGNLDFSHARSAISGNDEITEIAETFEQFANKIEIQQKELAKLALLDGLTGVANRRAFDSEWAKQFSQAKRFQQCLSLLLIDVDYFKPFNDFYGHQKGDAVLKIIATTINERLHRDVDLVARYGGEEFVVVLPDTEKAGAAKVANQLKDAIEALGIKHEKSGVASAVTISIGTSTLPAHESDSYTPEAIIKQADVALYCAKKLGRNRVEQS